MRTRRALCARPAQGCIVVCIKKKSKMQSIRRNSLEINDNDVEYDEQEDSDFPQLVTPVGLHLQSST